MIYGTVMPWLTDRRTAPITGGGNQCHVVVNGGITDEPRKTGDLLFRELAKTNPHLLTIGIVAFDVENATMETRPGVHGGRHFALLEKPQLDQSGNGVASVEDLELERRYLARVAPGQGVQVWEA